MSGSTVQYMHSDLACPVECHFAEKACMSDKKYCHGIIEIGQKLLKEGKFTEAEKFFTKGYSLNPDMNFLQQEFGRAHMKEGRYEDAIEYFKIARQMKVLYLLPFIWERLIFPWEIKNLH
jgi:tetratricopeptide (TPR) repeat protein